MVLALVGAGGTRDAAAQEARTTEVAVRAGLRFGVPRDLYRGWITASPDATPLPESAGDDVVAPIQTHYRERTGWQTGLETEFALRFPSRQYLALRLHAGRTGSTAFYAGGGQGPQELARSARWHGTDLLAGYSTPVRPSLHLGGYLGTGWQWWRMDTHGRGRDGLARAFGAEQPVQWSDRSWSSRGWVLGLELKYSPVEWLSWWLALEQNYHETGHVELAAGDRADIRRATGREPNIQFEKHSASWQTIALGVRWRLGSRVRPDPGALAAKALAGDAAPPRGVAAEQGAAALHEVSDAEIAARIAELESRLAAGERDAATVGELGVLLAHRSSAVQREFQDRLRAEQLLKEALRLDPGNARYLMALGLVYEKRGYTTDTRVVLDRALEAMAKEPDAVTPHDAAEALYRRARTREAQVLDFENLRMLAPGRAIPLGRPECGALNKFCINWSNPAEFFRAFQELPLVESAVDASRAAMLADLHRVLELEPAHAAANRMLLATYARTMDWAAFLAAARRYREAAPADAWASVYYAAGLYWTGQHEAADTIFPQAIARLTPDDRTPFVDLRPLLGPVALKMWDEAADDRREVLRETYWRQTDPLYLTSWSEHELEHYARVTLAHLWFSDPEAGIRGWETDRGAILVRYGRPSTVWQIPRDDGLLTDLEQAAERFVQPRTGGRWIFWNYDPARPSFIFEKTLGRAPVRHMFQSYSFEAAREAARLQPTTMHPPYRDAGAVAYQAAAFLDEDNATYTVDVYAAAPAAALGARRGDSLRTGVFLFRKRDFAPMHTERASVAAVSPQLDARIRLQPGVYTLVLEAATADGASAAASKTDLVVGAYAPGPLRLSDLLLAHDVEARTSAPASRHDLAIEPYRCVGRPANGRLALVFEVYGLTPGDGQTRYRVTVAAPGVQPTGTIPRLLRGLLRRGADDAGRVSFERVLEGERSRAVEWLDVHLPADAAPGDIELLVTVEDLQTGATARATRRLPMGGCGGSP